MSHFFSHRLLKLLFVYILLIGSSAQAGFLPLPDNPSQPGNDQPQPPPVAQPPSSPGPQPPQNGGGAGPSPAPNPQPSPRVGLCNIAIFDTQGAGVFFDFIASLLGDKNYKLVQLDSPKRFLINFRVSSSFEVVYGEANLFLYHSNRRISPVASTRSQNKNVELVFQDLIGRLPDCKELALSTAR
ncbi:MAG: hypothetical protein ACOYOK_03230 [Pseudobdellovibrionaceae bacterium]